MNNISMLIEYEEIDDILKVLNPDNDKVIDHVVENIEFGVQNNVALLPLFELKNKINNNLLVICLPEKDYKKTLRFIKKWAIEAEDYEAAGKSVEILKKIKND